MLDHEEVLTITSVAEPVRVVEPDLERAEDGIVHRRALLYSRTLLFGEKLEALQQSIRIIFFGLPITIRHIF